MNVFYCPDISGREAILSPEESAHCIRVLRLGAGAKVQVIDGQGGYFNAIISGPDPRRCRLEILETIDAGKPRDFKISIAIAPVKNMDRFEWFIEKSVEIGIDIITPLLCQRSERRALKTDRLQKLIISTMKQAIIPCRPRLNELMDFRQFISGLKTPESNRFIAHCEGSERKKLKETLRSAQDVLVLIGPEGDFSPEEVSLALQHGFVAVSLGENRLRTETAGVVACHTINLLNE